MNRIAGTIVILTFASATTGGLAATTPYPSSAPEEVPLAQEFPNIDSYKKEHRGSVATQAPQAGPAAALQEYPLSDEFPNLRTYQDIHRKDPVSRSMTSAFPSSVPNETSLAEEDLVPGMPRVPRADGNVGATR